mmetsp:Transcript_19170/g.43426  ORF Transcript_19170/g.43426 Transcript_19170/m.43426 type:complete len:232 (+) Transcript_19170:446-1141(+)
MTGDDRDISSGLLVKILLTLRRPEQPFEKGASPTENRFCAAPWPAARTETPGPVTLVKGRASSPNGAPICSSPWANVQSSPFVHWPCSQNLQSVRLMLAPWLLGPGKAALGGPNGVRRTRPCHEIDGGGRQGTCTMSSSPCAKVHAGPFVQVPCCQNLHTVLLAFGPMFATSAKGMDSGMPNSSGPCAQVQLSPFLQAPSCQNLQMVLFAGWAALMECLRCSASKASTKAA